MVEMLSGRTLFGHARRRHEQLAARPAVSAALAGGDDAALRAILHLPVAIRPATADLLKGLFQRRVEDRLSCEEVAVHEAFKDCLVRGAHLDALAILPPHLVYANVDPVHAPSWVEMPNATLWCTSLEMMQNLPVSTRKRSRSGAAVPDTFMTRETRELWVRLVHRAAGRIAHLHGAALTLDMFRDTMDGAMSIARKITGTFEEGALAAELATLNLLEWRLA
jgi:hypothetical protein